MSTLETLERAGGQAGVPADRWGLAGAVRPVPPDETVTPSELLEAQFPTNDRRERARLLLHHLRRLSAAEARLDLGIGQGLGALAGRFELRDIGFSHFVSFTEGPCGFSAAHGRELRRLARELPNLPALCDAFLAGLIPRTRVREVLAVATPETDAGWAQLARSMGTRPLARRVAAVKAGKSPVPSAGADDARRFERVGWLGSPADRSTWHFGRALVRQVTGVAGPDHVLAEALAAETLSSVGPDENADAGEPAPQPVFRARRRGERRLRAPSPGRLARLGRKLRRVLAVKQEAPLVELPDWGACANEWEVAAKLMALIRRRRSLDWERSRLLSWLHGRLLHHELGFARFTDAAERVLGLAPREALRLVTLARELACQPLLDAAWREGRLGTDALERLVSVVTPETEAAWIEYAATVTPKLLDAAIETVRAVGAPRALPPWAVPLRGLLADWQTHFGVARRRAEGGACAGPEAGGDEADHGLQRGACADQRPLLGRLCKLGFDAPADVAAVWREAQAAVRREAGTVLSDADVVRRLTRHFLDVHVTEEVLKRARQHAAIERDGWCCAMPQCRSRGPFHEHHVQFRSAGGSDDPSNLATLCRACHAMVHAGKVIIRGEAPDDLEFVLRSGEVWRGEVRAEAHRAWLARGRVRHRRQRTLRSLSDSSR